MAGTSEGQGRRARFDPALVARLLVLAPIAWTLPPATWPRVLDALTTLVAPLRAAHAAEEAQRLPPALLALWDTDAATVSHRASALYDQGLLQVLRCLRPGGWLPTASLRGGATIEAGLAEGKGAILWLGDFTFLSLAGKLALWQAGFRVSHLSRPSHGMGGDAAGLQFLNRQQQRLETRFLAERVVIDARTTRAGMRRLLARLRDNRLVSITVSGAARQQVETPFLGGQLQLASGPLNLARLTGAPLLPVLLRQVGPTAFEVSIGVPVRIDPALDREAAFQNAAAAYAEVLRAHLPRAPFLWQGWRHAWQPD